MVISRDYKEFKYLCTIENMYLIRWISLLIMFLLTLQF